MPLSGNISNAYLGQCFDEFMSVGHLAYSDHLFTIDIRISQTEITFNGIGEEHRLLLHDTYDIPEPFDVEVTNIVRVNHHSSSLGLIQPRQETNRCRLTTTAEWRVILTGVFRTNKWWINQFTLSFLKNRSKMYIATYLCTYLKNISMHFFVLKRSYLQ